MHLAWSLAVQASISPMPYATGRSQADRTPGVARAARTRCANSWLVCGRHAVMEQIRTPLLSPLLNPFWLQMLQYILIVNIDIHMYICILSLSLYIYICILYIIYTQTHIYYDGPQPLDRRKCLPASTAAVLGGIRDAQRQSRVFPLPAVSASGSRSPKP